MAVELEFNDIMELAADMDEAERNEFLAENGIEIPDYWVIIVKVEGGYAPLDVFDTKEEAVAERLTYAPRFRMYTTVLQHSELTDSLQARADVLYKAYNK